jgi:predicted nuclease of predicted toxin-antitoxin system
MTFLLDENFPKRAVPLLEAAGHSCLDARVLAPEGSADDALFRLAQDRQAVFLTTDKDFFHTVPTHFATHHGAVVIALSQPNGAAILARLADALRYLRTSRLAGKVLLLTDRRSYLR